MAGIRLQRSDLPKVASICPNVLCIYSKGGTCDQPDINKGNGDSMCHTWSNKRVIEMLKLANRGATP